MVYYHRKFILSESEKDELRKVLTKIKEKNWKGAYDFYDWAEYSEVNVWQGEEGFGWKMVLSGSIAHAIHSMYVREGNDSDSLQELIKQCCPELYKEVFE